VAPQPVGRIDGIVADVQPIQIAVGVVQGQAGKAKLSPGAILFQRQQHLHVPDGKGAGMWVGGPPPLQAAVVVGLVVYLEFVGVGLERADDGQHLGHKGSRRGPRAIVQAIVVQPDDELDIGVFPFDPLVGARLGDRQRLQRLDARPPDQRKVIFREFDGVPGVQPHPSSVPGHPSCPFPDPCSKADSIIL